jgi:hypothetical protein
MRESCWLDDCRTHVNPPMGFFPKVRPSVLAARLAAWKRLVGLAPGAERGEGGARSGGVTFRDADGSSVPRTGVGAAKEGQHDLKNEPHVGGNTWAGGTGGSDTAGLGGRGGPYRLDKGHTVHQVTGGSYNVLDRRCRGRSLAPHLTAAAFLALPLSVIGVG